MKMDKQEREIIGLLRKILSINNINNPCDIRGLAIYHNETQEKIDKVINYLDEIMCFDIPKYRKSEILQELKKQQ